MQKKCITVAVFVGLLVATSCRTSEDTTNFWQKKLKDREIVELSIKTWNDQLVGKKDGTVWITQESYKGRGSAFSLSANVKTVEKTAVDIAGSRFELETRTNPDYKVYSNLDPSRYDDFKPMFGKDITVTLDIAGQPPLAGRFYTPMPMDITGPVSTGDAVVVRNDAEITWVADPRNENGIVLDIVEMAAPDKTTGVVPPEKSYLLLTPDDGKIKVESLLTYIPQNGNKFQIYLKRYNYKTVEAGGKKYRFLASTSEHMVYKFVPPVTP